MKFLLFSVLFFTTAFGQQVFQIVALDNSLNESSGALFLNQKIITHNDSQGGAELYEVDSLTGLKTRTVAIPNASNNDWEDLANDDTYIYIGDFGNNSGDRTDLKIYRIAISDYWNTPNDTVYADTIRFTYFHQTNFSPQPSATNWDCEAMTLIGDSIYLFSKNWINQKTYVYVLPKTLGDYSLSVRDSIAVQGLITSADFNTFSNRLVLAGYTPFNPFIVEIDWNPNVPISQLNINRYSISVSNSIQIEAITSISANQYFLTSEYYSGKDASLMRLVGKNGSLSLQNSEKLGAIVFPNPINQNFTVQFSKIETNVEASIFNELGQLVSVKERGDLQKFELEAPKKVGVYFLQIKTIEGVFIEKIVVQ